MLVKDVPPSKGERRAFLVAVAKVKGFRYLPQAHKDAWRMRTFLISRGYPPENIVVMMHDKRVAKNLWPSRENLLHQIDLMVKRTTQYDQIFFYYTGHGDQVPCKHGTESDFKDEAILTYTGKRIIDNILKKRLVNPLPRGAKFFALWDCCHSHTVLDLDHYNCNTWLGPLRVLSGLARKTRNLSKKLSASLLRDNSGSRRSTRDDSQARTEGPKIDNPQYSNIPRSSSPEPFSERCTRYCPMVLPEDRVKAHVVSLSACRDNESAYDDNVKGETVTKFFIEHLELHPTTSYEALLLHIQQRVDGITQRRTGARHPTGERSHYQHRLQSWSENDVEIEDQDQCGHHEYGIDDDDTATLNSQRPSYSSHYRMDLSQIVDI